MKRLLIVTIVLAACGGSEKPAPKDNDPAAKPAMDEHDKLTPELTAFHDVLKPLWHQDKGEAQVTATCDAGADLQAKAKAVTAAAVPAGVDAAQWQQLTLGLEKSVDKLIAICGADRSGFDAAFADVHTAFHAAMGAQMGESHDEHMEGMEHGEGMEHH